MFLFVVSDLYDLNNSRVLIDFLATNGYEVFVFFLTTPVKPYRKVFLHYQHELIKKTDMPGKIEKGVGDMNVFNSMMAGRKFEFTFFCCSYFSLLEKRSFFLHRDNMGKLCLITWGWDGTDDKNIRAYEHASHVFAEGPLFFDRSRSRQVLKKHKDKIVYSHPYYDVFDQYSRQQCREKLGISTNKLVVLIPETGNIANIEGKWAPLYRSIIAKVDRSKFFVVFKGRRKLVSNPCKPRIKPHVDLYVDNEWLFPPCSALVSMASDICIMPCESRFLLEATMSRLPTIMHSQRKFKGNRATTFFGSVAQHLKFNAFSYLNRGLSSDKAEHNRAIVETNVAVIQDGGNCEFIRKTLGI